MIKRLWLGAVAMVTVALFACPSNVLADGVDNWCANYVSDSQTGLHRFTIRKDHDEVKIHVWAIGFPNEVDWGESVAEVYKEKGGTSPRFIAHFSVSNTKAMLVVSPNTGGASPGNGGLVVADVYIKQADGSPREYFDTSFQTPK